MAQKRMFSKRITMQPRFTKMPPSSQLLYFHLGINADDDGIVEAYNILKMTGITEDSLKVLVAKGFVKVLNEDLVTFISDWHEHNYIRADRKVNSIYSNLLLQILPQIELQKSGKRADTGKITASHQIDGQWTDNGRTMDGIDQVRLGKDSIDQDNENSNNSFPLKADKEDDHDINNKQCNELNKEKERKDITPKKYRPKQSLPSLPTRLMEIPGFIKNWDDWLTHKKEIKNKVTPLSAVRQLNMLLKQDDPIAVINQAIEKGWKGLFPLKDNNQKLYYADQQLMNKLSEIGFKDDRLQKAYNQAKDWKLDYKIINKNNYDELAAKIKDKK